MRLQQYKQCLVLAVLTMAAASAAAAVAAADAQRLEQPQPPHIQLRQPQAAATAAEQQQDKPAGTPSEPAVLPAPVAAASGGQAGTGLRQLPRPPEEKPQKEPHAAMDTYLERFFRQQGAQAVGRPSDYATHEGDTSLLERLIGKQEEGSCGVDMEHMPIKREYLVVLPAGDDFDASKWLRQPELANWDLVAIYYGSRTDFSCPLCKAVYAAAGPKWRLAYRFTLLDEWQQYRQRYKAVLWPDDDLVMDTCTVNKLFSVLTAYDLLLAQPSLCQAVWSHTPWKQLYQQGSNILRYTTFVEIMAPVFNMDFFQDFVRPSLYNAHVGWGLDFVWPFLLRYPLNKIAVIDEVCIYHPPSSPQKSNSVYSADAPFTQKEEESRRFAEYGYFESEIKQRGYYFQAVEVLGVVPKPALSESLLETSNKVLQARLGAFYPLLLLGQTLMIAAGCLAVVAMRMRQWHQSHRKYMPMKASGVM